MSLTTNERVFRNEDGLISKIDLNGRFTFVNDTFVHISGYSRDELIGQPLSMVRHPDMPEEVFADLWNTVKAGKSWTATIKNRCKNGKFYWVESNVTPIREHNNIIGYISVRTKPSREQIVAAESLYRDMKAGKLALREGKAIAKGMTDMLLVLKKPSIKMRLAVAVFLPCFLLFIFGITVFNGMAIQYPILYFLFLGLGVIGSLAIGYYSISSFSRSLQDIARVIACGASGDFTHRVPVNSHDEIGRIQESLEVMNRNVRRIMSNICKSTDIVKSTSEEITKGNKDLNERTENQGANLQETATSVEMLTSTIRENEVNIKQANQLGAEASAIALNSGKTVSQVVQTMHLIHESSKQVATITNVIDEIAFQTNILALNAAVETARAGIHGRSFAVVATEVRMLAQRSAAAAKEISDLINDSVSKVENGTLLADKAGKTMEDAVNSVKQVTGILTQITAASQEQSIGIEQINESITQLDHVTNENMTLVEEANISAEVMRSQIQNLYQEIEVLKLENEQTKPVSKERRNQIKQYVATKVRGKKDQARGHHLIKLKRMPGKNRDNAQEKAVRYMAN